MAPAIAAHAEPDSGIALHPSLLDRCRNVPRAPGAVIAENAQ